MFTYPGGRITATLCTLKMLIQEAFDIQAFQIQGGPEWIDNVRYDIVARPPASSNSSNARPPYPKAPPSEEQRAMLQTLLADRFHLRLHRVVKPGPTYVLVRGSKPLKLRPAANANEFPWAGGLNGGMIAGDGVAGINISMPLLCKRLSRYLERPVYDFTGLPGSFDFRAEYGSDREHPDDHAGKPSDN